MDLVIADRDNVGAVYFEMSEDDVKLAMRQPWVSVGTDYGEVSPTGPLGESKSHPRAYGSFARILGKYVREEHNLAARGRDSQVHLAAGAARETQSSRLAASPTTSPISPSSIQQRCATARPLKTLTRPSVGFEYVFVNGVLALEHDKVTGQFGGRPLRGPGYMMRDSNPEGLPVAGKLQGFVTDEGGWPLPRAAVVLDDSTGKEITRSTTKKSGGYELVVVDPCKGVRCGPSAPGSSPSSAATLITTEATRCGSASCCRGSSSEASLRFRVQERESFHAGAAGCLLCWVHPVL